MSNTNIKGSFWGFEVRRRQLSGAWVTSAYVPPPIPDQEYGWFSGGSPGSKSTIERIDYTNDLTTSSIRGPLSSAVSGASGTGNNIFGWIGGGFPGPRSTVERIDYLNDLITTSVRGPLSSSRSYTASTGNSNFGWFGAGTAPGFPTVFTTVDRINYSNDLATASVRGPLSLARRYHAASGNTNYGWFGGGNAPNFNYSTVDRVDYTNDAVTASVRGPLSAVKNYLAASGNENYGWFAGGAESGTTTPTASVHRIDHSNDSITTSVRGQLSVARRWLSSTGNTFYGWVSGGVTFSGANSTVERLNYTNDSTTAEIRTPLSSSRYRTIATGGFPG